MFRSTRTKFLSYPPVFFNNVAATDLTVLFSNEVNQIHKKARYRRLFFAGMLSLTKNESERILWCFKQVYRAKGVDGVERMKNLISVEEHDFADMTDLVADMTKAERINLLTFFASPSLIPKSDSFSIKVISDLDNTLIESSAFAPSIYVSGGIVFGAIPLFRALTRESATTMTLVSARPRELETHSIYKIKKALNDSNAPAFSFASGEIIGSLHYGTAKLSNSIGSSKLTRAELISACNRFAVLKYKCYKRLRNVYPFSTFVFSGDDTQGDYAFAAMMIANAKPGEKCFAFIRNIETSSKSVTPFGSDDLWPATLRHIKESTASSQNIIYHKSYYEAIVRAPDWLLPHDIRKHAARLAVEEFDTKYKASVLAFENADEAIIRDKPWIDILRRLISSE